MCNRSSLNIMLCFPRWWMDPTQACYRISANRHLGSSSYDSMNLCFPLAFDSNSCEWIIFQSINRSWARCKRDYSLPASFRKIIHSEVLRHLININDRNGWKYPYETQWSIRPRIASFVDLYSVHQSEKNKSMNIVRTGNYWQLIEMWKCGSYYAASIINSKSVSGLNVCNPYNAFG